MIEEKNLTEELNNTKEVKTPEIVKDEKKEVKTKPEVEVKTLTDALQIFEALNSVKTNKTLKIPLISQGIELTSEAMTLSDIHNIVNSDKYRVRIYEKCFEKLSKESKAIFDNKIKVFKESVSYYDMDLFLSRHIDSWGEEDFENICSNDNCEENIKYSKPLGEMLVIGDLLTKRLDDIRQGIAKGVFKPESPVFILNDNIKLIFSLPSIERFELVSDMDMPEILIPAILHIESLIIKAPNGDDDTLFEIKLNKDTVKEIITVLDSNKVGRLNEAIGETFNYLDIKYEVNVACPACGTINKFIRVDLIDVFINKVLG